MFQPLRRADEPEDIANTAPWLASDDSSFVTAQSIVVDGGLTAGNQWSKAAAAVQGAHADTWSLAVGRKALAPAAFTPVPQSVLHSRPSGPPTRSTAAPELRDKNLLFVR